VSKTLRDDPAQGPQDLRPRVAPTLDPYTLLKVSMASRTMKRLVDKLASDVFAYSSQFELNAASGLRGLLVLNFDEQRRELYYTYTAALKRESEKHSMLSRMHMEVGRLVSMTIDFHVPLKHIVLPGSLLPNDMVHIFVTRWKVVCIREEPHDQTVDARLRRGSLANVRFEAVLFTALGRVEMPFAIILNVRNVLVDNSLTARERAVMSVCSTCMNCRQRPRIFESIGVSDQQYRLLCRRCFTQLFVKVDSLHATWKVCKDRIFKAKHLYQVHNFISGSRWSPKFDEAVLKEHMARALGFRSWDHFLKQNYTSPLPFSRSQKNGARMYAWKCPRTKLF
jgi:hypothetical protein